MIVTFLGTGTSQGVPVISCDCSICNSLDFRDKRLRSAIHIQTENLSLVVDSGPDFRQQMLRERIKRLDALIFTHEHKDHTAGMDDIRSYNYRQEMDIPVYARKNVIEQLKKEFEYIFTEQKYPGIPKIQIHEIENHPFFIDDLQIIPIQVLHYKLPVFGYRIKDFTYITDANHIPDEEKEKIYGTKILVLNALQLKPHISHFNLEQAINLAMELKAEKTYFTHISHHLGTHSKISKELPENVFLGYDGLKIRI